MVSYIGNALNKPVKIFVDRTGIANGESWPLRLRTALARSRCLVPIWQPLYFHSPWCRRECTAMLHRERKLGYRTNGNPSGLIVPINVFDEEFFPDRARSIQWLDCKAYWVVGDGFSKTERYIEFQETLKRWAVDAATAINGAPAWEARFETTRWFSTSDRGLMPKSTANFEFSGLDR